MSEMGDLARISDEALIVRLQRAAFSYLSDYANDDTGLVADTSRQGSPCSIAVVGFALSCYPVAVRNGWFSRADAGARTLNILRFFWESTQSDASDATGYKGFYYHFLDMRTGRRVWQCELSLIDTALLIAGVLVVGCFFDADDEREIRELADALYRRVDWRWAQNGRRGLSQGWKPESGFLHYGWEGYNEAALLYVLGLGSPTFPLTPAAYATWQLTYQWENLLDRDVLHSGPLFTHLFSHAWIDFRAIRDTFMREKASDYFENTKSAIAIHREYGERNPHGFKAYSRDFWETVQSMGKRMGETAASSAICRAACLTALTTARSHLGRCLQPCRLAPRRRLRARAVFSKTIRKSAARTDFRAASIRRCGAMRAAGFRKVGTGSIRACL
jgi:hypothetical protein